MYINEKTIIELISSGKTLSEFEIRDFADSLLSELNHGVIRAAEPMPDGSWKVNIWVKQAILLLFKYGTLIDMSIDQHFQYFDKNTIPLHPFRIEDGIRIVPGGS